MKIPESVRIAGMVYTTNFDSQLIRHRQRFGEVGLDYQDITIDPSISQQKQEQVWVHELFESINEEYDLELEHHKISLLATALYQIIQDNPNIFNEGDVDAN